MFSFAIALSASVTAPALAAERVFACENGSFVTLNAYEARIGGIAGGIALALPLQFDGDHVSVYAPRSMPDDGEVRGCEAPFAPCVERTFTMGKYAAAYQLDDSQPLVQCDLVR